MRTVGLSVVGSFASTKWAVARCQSPVPRGSGVGSGDGSGLNVGCYVLAVVPWAVIPVLWAAVCLIPLYHISTPIIQDDNCMGPVGLSCTWPKTTHVMCSKQCPAQCFIHSCSFSLLVKGTVNIPLGEDERNKWAGSA